MLAIKSGHIQSTPQLSKGFIQPKLKIGKPNDRYEQEADRMADHVINKKTDSFPKIQKMEVGEEEEMQLKCAACEHEETVQRQPEEKEEEMLQPKSNGTSPSASTIEAQLRSSKGSGQPMENNIRAEMEAGFGTDFSKVRIHNNSNAIQMSQQLNAQAFTNGNDIYFNSGKYDTASRGGKHLLAHELTHTIQQTKNNSRIVQRAQIGRVHTPSTAPHFLYELDSKMSTFSQLASYYGSSTSAIQTANPSARPTALKNGQQIKIPAVNVPPANSQPSQAGTSAIVQSTKTIPLKVYWSNGGNRVGRIKRGSSVFTFANGVDIPVPTIESPAKGIIEEMTHRNLVAGGMMLYGYIDPTNLRATNAALSSGDLDLMARMIWGEQRSQGEDAMTAAAWIVRNRYDGGWGTISQIITKQQFHGIVPKSSVQNLTGADKKMWVEAQRIAKEVTNNTLPDPTGGVVYFGNGTSVKNRMAACKKGNSAFTYGQISGTNFYYSNGDYTANCSIP